MMEECSQSILMHLNKCIIDGWLLIHGSFNWSKNASQGSEEEQEVTNHPYLVGQYGGRLTSLYSGAVRIKVKHEERPKFQFIGWSGVLDAVLQLPVHGQLLEDVHVFSNKKRMQLSIVGSDNNM